MFQSCAPLKVLFISRLELYGVQLLAQLMDKIINTLKDKIDEKYYWTSLIVLHWIQDRQETT